MNQVEEAYDRLMQAARFESGIDRGKVREAYDLLSNPQARTQYNRDLITWEAERARRREKPGRRTLPIALVIGVGLIAVILMWSRSIRSVEEFRLGDELYVRDTGRKFGSIIDVAKDHAFEDGRRGPGYQVALEDESERWFTKSEIALFCQSTPGTSPPRPLRSHEIQPPKRPKSGSAAEREATAPLPGELDEPAPVDPNAVTAPLPEEDGAPESEGAVAPLPEEGASDAPGTAPLPPGNGGDSSESTTP